MQRILPFELSPSYRREDFIVSNCNKQAFDWINCWPNWPHHALMLHGPSASGKTHLAAIFQEKQPGNCKVIELVTPLDEQALLHFYNSIKENGQYLLITSNLPLSELQIQLPDLKSRLKSIMQVAIGQPDDMLLRAVMIKGFLDRQITVEKDVLEYLMARIERSFQSVQRILQKIDQLAFQHKRPITIPLVREIVSGQSSEFSG